MINTINIMTKNDECYTKYEDALEKLISLEIPFIILQGAQQWFSNQKCIWWLSDYSKHISLLIPNKRMSFNRPNQPEQKTNPAFLVFDYVTRQTYQMVL